MIRHFRPIVLGLLLAGFLRPVESACAQVDSADLEGARAGQLRSPIHQGGTILKQDESGQWYPVPLDQAAFDDKLPSHPRPEANELVVPDYFLSKLRLDGTVTEEWVDLTAALSVVVVAENRWLQVPLRFDPGLLLGVEHEGAGEAAPNPKREGSKGISWLLRGEGEHHLRLSLRVPLRKTPEGNQLQFQLPTLGLFTGELELRIPSAAVTIRDSDAVRLRGTRTEGDATIVSADLLGERFDLRWNTIVQPSDPIIQSPTEITLRLEEQKIELTAHQEVQFRGGQEKNLRVRLPSGNYDISPLGVRVRDSNSNERWVQPLPTDQRAWVTVPLQGVVGNLVELDWQFTIDAAESGNEIVIDGFDVADGRKHTGTISIVNPGGYRVSRIEDGDAWIKRVDVGQMQASLAYAFSGGRFRLRLDVEPVIPSLSVTPYYYLLVSKDRIVLEAAFQITVEDGKLRNVPIRWPKNRGTPWTVSESLVTAGRVREITPVGEAHPVSERQWLLPLPEVADHSTVVGLSGAYFFSFDEPQDAASFSLPVVSGARMLPGRVSISTDDNVEVTTRAREGTVLTRSAERVLSTAPVTSPDWTGTQPQTEYRLTLNDAESAPGLDMQIAVRDQLITTSAVVEITHLARQPRISQRIAYDVQFGRLSHVRLRMPQRLAAQIPEEFRTASLRFSLNGETPLAAQWFGDVVSLKLPAPQWGAFEIVVEDYPQVPKPGPGAETLAVPIIGSLDQPYQTVRLSVPDPDAISVALADLDWTRLTTLADGMQWITGQKVEEASLTLDRSVSRSPLRLIFNAALLQTRIDEAGMMETNATYLVAHPLSRLLVQLPADAENLQFEWNGRTLPDRDVREEPDVAGHSQHFRLNLPAEPLTDESPDQRLTIRYRRALGAIRWSQSGTVDFPKFPDGVWIEQTWWELTLPASQHLFVPPENMAPQYHWDRTLAIWSRRPNPEFEQARRDILGNSFLEQSSTDNSGNVYPFLSLGSPEQVRYRTLSKSLIVLVGAGLTLTLSFLLLKVPAARHPLLWLAAGLTLTTASLWYWEPMLLLLQPAAYGLLLPLGAALLEQATPGGRLFARSKKPAVRHYEFIRDNRSRNGVPGSSDPQMVTTHIHATSLPESGIEP